jgi:hypothetical protein
MMRLSFPEDYKSERHIQNGISDFARIILWEESDSYPGRIMVKARVMSVEVMP